jgi:predicted small metal-binding protein
VPWLYYCSDEDITLKAESKEQLVDEVMQHMKDAHNLYITREQAWEKVNADGKQAAA